MNFRNFILTVSVLLMIGLNASAKKVTMPEAEKVAKNFMYERINQYGQGIRYQDVVIAESWEVASSYFVFNLNEGWVIVAARDERQPIIGYGYEGKFPRPEQLNYNTNSWLTTFIDEKDFILANQPAVDAETTQLWNHLLTSDINTLETREMKDVTTPLLTIMWNQDSPYNLMCPEDAAGPGGHVYVGCVATAMSMIMYYWRYPLQGLGSYSYYQSPYGIISANFGETFYNWDGMQDEIETENPWDIAEIGFHAAVSVTMNFGPDGSGSYSYTVPAALKNRFRFGSSTQYLEKSSYNVTQWENMLQEQITNHYPVYYSGQGTGGGHAFVCDGFEGMNYYHFNFGWSGSGNGWFNLQNVGGFSGSQAMVRNIIPGDADYPYIASGQTILTSRSGSFTDGSGPIEDYPSGMDASWLISPQNETDSVKTITLSFVEMNTAASDYIRVYNGTSTSDPMVGEFSGTNIPASITVQNNHMLVTFSSSSSAAGFKAEYKSTSPTWCNSSTVITAPYGTFGDGSQSFDYNNLTTCVFILQVPEAIKYHLSFDSFSTEANKDLLKIYNGSNQLLATLSGTDIPAPITVSSGSVFMTWSTNNTIRDHGWQISYEVDGVGLDENHIFEQLNVYPNPANEAVNIGFHVQQQQNITISIVSLSGQEIYREQLNSFKGDYRRTLQLDEVVKGVYLLKLQSDAGLSTRKIVVN